MIWSPVKILSFRSSKPSARRALAARSASAGSLRMATKKPFGLKTRGRADRSGSVSVVPTGQTIGSSAIAVGPQRVGQRLLQRSGLGAELVGDLAAVDDERLGELVLHLHELAHRG